ncbi:heterokaryon incompatibility protein-domain-containing protein [Hyaloscypha finlandica]|nr:heterokaryon incompatibility protein-domain-containing protein [Hyaloscypha finlandica]
MPASTTYAALSYAWGSPEKVSKILVKDIDARPNGWIPLTLNLDNALHDLLASDLQPKTLWIDQICINQDDNAEKGLQVAMFGQIYRMASRVVTYLGPAKRNVDAAVSLLDRIFSHFSPKLEELHVPYHEGIIQLFRTGGQEFMFDEDSPGWDVVLDRALSPWLSRVWMVQENLLNRNTQVLFGPRLLDQHKLLMIPILIHEELLPGALALDPARVFALLGVASDTETLGIQANYDASEQDVLIDTTMRIINVKDNLQVLSENRYPVRERRKDLPSWVPDWKDKDKVDAYGFIGSGKASSGMPASGRFEQGNRVLVLDGLIVARLNKPIAAKPITLRSMYRQLLRGDQVPEIEDLNQMLVKLEEALGRDRDDLNYRLGCLLLTVRQLPEEFSGIMD